MDKCELWLHVVKNVFFVKAFSKEAPLRLNIARNFGASSDHLVRREKNGQRNEILEFFQAILRFT